MYVDLAEVDWECHWVHVFRKQGNTTSVCVLKFFPRRPS